MRIVGGQHRGRQIAAPSHDGVRPTSDRVRESVFNILSHGIEGYTLEGARALDLFAGTGALGLEALSRGASFCLFVDIDADARALVRRNVEALGLTGVSKIFRRDATDMGRALPRDRASLAFLDPPYGKGMGERALASLAAGGWLEDGAVVVLEERAGAGIVLPPGYEEIDRRTYGDTQVVLARFSAT